MPNMTTPKQHPSSGIYYFRKGVPKDVRHILKKTEFKASLDTKVLAEAKSRIGRYIAEAENEIALARASIASTSELNPRDLAILADRWLDEAIAEVESSGEFTKYTQSVPYFDEARGLQREHLVGTSDFLDLEDKDDSFLASYYRYTIESLLKAQSIAIPFDTQQFKDLAVKVHHASIKLEQLCLKRLDDDWVSKPVTIHQERLSSESTKPVTTIQRKAADVRSLSMVYEEYREYVLKIDENANTASKEKTLDEAKLDVTRFVEAIGDKDVRDITKTDIIDYRSCLLKLPKSKKAAIKRLPLLQQVELAEKEGLTTLSTSTVNKNIRLLSGVLQYALDTALISANPAHGAGITASKSKAKLEKVAEKGYKQTEITELFSNSAFNDANADHPYGAACYWLPILCYYTGARIQELAQLYRSDIKSDNGDYYISITEDLDGKTVKNLSSVRDVPIHSHLIELGFIEFVDSCSDNELFGQLPKDKYGKRASSIGKWFKRIAEGSLSTSMEGRQPLHSFRHTFKTLCRSLNIPEDIHDALTGHSGNSVSRSYGEMPLTTLSEAINKIPRLKLSPIR